jgi:hypothetical protein
MHYPVPAGLETRDMGQRGKAATQGLEKADYDYEDGDEDENLRKRRELSAAWATRL